MNGWMVGWIDRRKARQLDRKKDRQIDRQVDRIDR